MRFLELTTREYKGLLSDPDLATLYRDGLEMIFELLVNYSVMANAPEDVENPIVFYGANFREAILKSIEEADQEGWITRNISRNYGLASTILAIPNEKMRKQEAENFVDQVLVQYLDMSRCIKKDEV